MTRLKPSTLTAVLLLTLTVQAQESAKQTVLRKGDTVTLHKGDSIVLKPGSVVAINRPELRFKFDYGDVVLLTGFAFDTVSGTGKREANPLFRDANGRLAAGRNLVVKGGLFAAFKLLEFHYREPSERRVIRRFKVVIGAGLIVLAGLNFRQH